MTETPGLAAWGPCPVCEVGPAEPCRSIVFGYDLSYIHDKREEVPMPDVEAKELARELNIPVAELLARADKLIGEVVTRDGVDAARGLTTRTRSHGQTTDVAISSRLADALRGK